MKDYLEKRREELRKQGGFTLMEMLIVVAIIAVLIAIAIPVFSAQLEKSREATDAANIRAAYAEVMVQAIDSDSSSIEKTVDMKQTVAQWQNAEAKEGLVSVFGKGQSSASSVLNGVTQGSKATISWVPGSGSTEGHATISF